MVRGALFYLTRIGLFLPATLYALMMLAPGGNFEFLKWYALGPAVLLVFFFVARRPAPEDDSVAGLSGARARGLLIFSLLQFHWLLLILPVVRPAWLWIGLAALTVILGGVLARTARPMPNPAAILIAIGALIALGSGGVLPLGGRGDPVAPVAALSRFGSPSSACFWDLFFKTKACSLGESFPEAVWISAAALLLFQRQYVFEVALALALAGLVFLAQIAAGLSWSVATGPAVLAATLTLVILLLPGRERRSQRGWWFYGVVWISAAGLLNFSNYLIPDLHFYFQNTGAGNSWLFWVAGLFLAEILILGRRFWVLRRDILG